MDSDEILFEPETNEENHIDAQWTVLIVDDDSEVHKFTKLALRNFHYDGKKVEFLSAYSAEEAENILKEHKDIAVILLDVVMETRTSGLELVEYIRSVLKDDIVRIIIRTGQAGDAPERHVIDHYDITDYKEKTELTTDKLYTTVRTSLAQYKQLNEILNTKDEIYNTLITDNLTGIGNRTKLNYDLDSEEPKSLILLNIDAFSMINDVYGFYVGDQLLIQFKDLLVEVVAKDWEVYRLEADIFSLLSNATKSADIYKEVEHIKNCITGHSFLINGVEYRVNVTIAIVEHEIGNIIQKAEIALHEARNLGRNRVQAYSNDLNVIKKIEENTKWTKWLKDALDSNSVLAYFQPIVDCKTDEIVKYETLVRLERDGVVYTPYHFLATARYAGLLYQITKRMFTQACEKFSKNSLSFSINITDQDLIEEDFISFIEKTRAKYNIHHSRISFEILEESSILNDPIAEKHLHKLTDLGYSLSLDDFGVQCSNFAQVGNLFLDCIKIDGIYIKDLDENKSSYQVTDTILYFTRQIGVKTVAEFVHSEEIYKTVKSMGVDYAQGYFLGKPEPDLV